VPTEPCFLRIDEIDREEFGSFSVGQPARPGYTVLKLAARACAPKLTEAGGSFLLLVVPVVPPCRDDAPVHERECKHNACTRLPRPT
jgi:hypothetical protein